MRFICALCEHRAPLEVLSYSSYPAFLVPLPPELARTVIRAPVTLVTCRACGHLQIPNVDAEVQRVLYEVYYKHYEVDTLETMIPAYREPFNRLVESLAAEGMLPNGRLLEIGCSSGAMIPFLSQYCREYTGIDPSERIEIARTTFPQHTFIRSYFPFETRTQFDVAVTQFNLEHIENVANFVSALATAIVVGGVLLVQVPDAGYFIRTRQPNFVAHEHVHYFRRAQLSMLLASRGFAVERWGEEGASLICAARRVEQPTRTVDLEEDPLADAMALRAMASDVPRLPRRPLLYGVGLTLHWLLAKIDALASDADVIDDNPNYQGKGVPGYDLLIGKPSRELLDGRDVVLTLNAIYHERVLERLRALGGMMRVHRITADGWKSMTL